jgi:hypothetical protein
MATSQVCLGGMSNFVLTELGSWGNLGISNSMMDYNKTREDANRRRTELIERKQKIKEEKQKLADEEEQNKRELIGIEQILDGLDFVSGDILPELEPTGFTDSIRKILSETSMPLVPTQIRDALQQRGITGSSAKNLLINVHKVLERIADELEESTAADGKTAYKRTTPWLVAVSALMAPSNPPTGKEGNIIQRGYTDDSPLTPEQQRNRLARLAKLTDHGVTESAVERLVLEAAARRRNRTKKED